MITFLLLLIVLALIAPMLIPVVFATLGLIAIPLLFAVACGMLWIGYTIVMEVVNPTLTKEEKDHNTAIMKRLKKEYLASTGKHMTMEQAIAALQLHPDYIDFKLKKKDDK